MHIPNTQNLYYLQDWHETSFSVPAAEHLDRWNSEYFVCAFDNVVAIVTFNS